MIIHDHYRFTKTDEVRANTVEQHSSQTPMFLQLRTASNRNDKHDNHDNHDNLIVAICDDNNDNHDDDDDDDDDDEDKNYDFFLES